MPHHEVQSTYRQSVLISMASWTFWPMPQTPVWEAPLSSSLFLFQIRNWDLGSWTLQKSHSLRGEPTPWSEALCTSYCLAAASPQSPCKETKHLEKMARKSRTLSAGMRAYTESSGDLVKTLCIGLYSKWILKNLCNKLHHFANRTTKTRTSKILSVKVSENDGYFTNSPRSWTLLGTYSVAKECQNWGNKCG